MSINSSVLISEWKYNCTSLCFQPSLNVKWTVTSALSIIIQKRNIAHRRLNEYSFWHFNRFTQEGKCIDYFAVAGIFCLKLLGQT